MIPSTLHFVWVGSPMPGIFGRFIQQWAQLHPGWTVRVWGDDGLRWLDNLDLFDAADEIAKDHAGQLRSDVARYEILDRFGGVYVDCDMEPLRPIDALIDLGAFAAWETDGEWVNNAVLASAPGHPLWGELITALPSSVANRSRGARPAAYSGPRFLTPRVLGRDDVTILPSYTFYPYRWDRLDRANADHGDAYAVHHWANARRRKGVPLDG